jgi:hypothetical protein
VTAALLKPRNTPLRALRQIASIARGNPMHLSTLARRSIAVRSRTRPNGEPLLDTTALEARAGRARSVARARESRTSMSSWGARRVPCR